MAYFFLFTFSVAFLLFLANQQKIIKRMEEGEKALRQNREALERVNRDLASSEKVLLQMLNDMEQANQALKKAQDQLIQSEKMATVGILASGVAHEIKNPLAIILQAVGRIEKNLTKKDEQGIKYTEMVKSAALRADKVVSTLLTFSRSSELETAPFDIHEAIDSALALVENRAKSDRIDIRRNYEKKSLIVNGEQILLSQVFFDLFTNAIDAMPEGGTLEIKTALEASGGAQNIVVEIKDTGTGIPAEHLPRVFDPFFTTKDPGKGTGLGLSMAYLILQRHQGTISMESELRKGTVFIVKLPVLREGG